jgi:hypothetical protein
MGLWDKDKDSTLPCEQRKGDVRNTRSAASSFRFRTLLEERKEAGRGWESALLHHTQCETGIKLAVSFLPMY